MTTTNENQNIATQANQLPGPTVNESVEGLKSNIAVIQRVMRDVMRDGEHYGVIPGTGKPSLYKSGAEKLSFVFRLATEYTIRQTDLPGGHREYEVICKLYSIETGKFLGSGVGICSTMEKKYRYRNEYKATNEPVPKTYWDNGQNKKYLPKGMSVTKTESGWRLARVEQIENPDIADCYNTVLKIGKKRSQVDATLTVTAASDIFSQDIEDFVEADSVSEQEARPEKEISSAPKADSKPVVDTRPPVPTPTTQPKATPKADEKSLEEKLEDTKSWLLRTLTEGKLKPEDKIKKIKTFKKLWEDMRSEFESQEKLSLFNDGLTEFEATLHALGHTEEEKLNLLYWATDRIYDEKDLF
ncbi:hypothetical protein [Leptospira santarosai]|uniref:RecT family protein n=1 Tax=Leptospira santarosai str. ZUN179 TaxID=1049985 RepID=M6UGY6_9LEPT|nr:hypothetical protein [Leptospira santarosai]EMO43815.1 hypothetical protein LEP1GSC187_0483 [Leptospira santarosai str. ZUN179]